jgi:hypothetical protein
LERDDGLTFREMDPAGVTARRIGPEANAFSAVGAPTRHLTCGRLAPDEAG